MGKALETIRIQATRLRLYRDVIDIALDDAWETHIQVFKVAGRIPGDEKDWKHELYEKWLITAMNQSTL